MLCNDLPSHPVGVFDSGIGGLSILKALRAEMPLEHFVYFADSAHNPYGEKTDAFIVARSLSITEQLVKDHGIKALVVACNTATAAAIDVLRAQYPGLPIVGVEPALKPAVALSQTKRIAVLATRNTLQSAKFLALKASLAGQAEFICTPCDGLADAIEQNNDPQITINLIANYTMDTQANCRFGSSNKAIDTLVLGCTHYPLILPYFRQAVGTAVQIVDNGQAVAKRVANLLAQQNVGATASKFSTSNGPLLLGSGCESKLLRAATRWL